VCGTVYACGGLELQPYSFRGEKGGGGGGGGGESQSCNQRRGKKVPHCGGALAGFYHIFFIFGGGEGAFLMGKKKEEERAVQLTRTHDGESLLAFFPKKRKGGEQQAHITGKKRTDH